MIKCNRGCGVDNLHWKIVNDKFKLFQDDLLHMCNDGILSNKVQMKKQTNKILDELGLEDAKEIPTPDIPETKTTKTKDKAKTETVWAINKHSKDAKKCFTITSTVNGIAITGDDKHNPIYLPKIAISELTKALVDFI